MISDLIIEILELLGSQEMTTFCQCGAERSHNSFWEFLAGTKVSVYWMTKLMVYQPIFIRHFERKLHSISYYVSVLEHNQVNYRCLIGLLVLSAVGLVQLYLNSIVKGISQIWRILSGLCQVHTKASLTGSHSDSLNIWVINVSLKRKF